MITIIIVIIIIIIIADLKLSASAGNTLHNSNILQRRNQYEMQDALCLKIFPWRCVPLQKGVKTTNPAEDNLPRNNYCCPVSRWRKKVLPLKNLLIPHSNGSPLKAISADIPLNQHIDSLSTDYQPTIDQVSNTISIIDIVVNISVDTTYSNHDALFVVTVSLRVVK